MNSDRAVPDMQIVEWAEGICRKTVVPDQIPPAYRDLVQVELLKRGKYQWTDQQRRRAGIEIKRMRRDAEQTNGLTNDDVRRYR